jgi:Sigma-70, region 4
VARVSLDMLRARTARREDALDMEAHEPRPTREAVKSPPDPEQETMLAESVGLALLVVLGTLQPAERISFVLHDLFAIPFEEIASILGRSPAATRQLASRARRRVQGANVASSAEIVAQRKIIDKFLFALRSGDVEALIAVLDPDVVIRADRFAQPSEALREVRGARQWAPQAIAAARGARAARPAIIDGSVGLIIAPRGRLFGALRFTFANRKVASFEVIGDPERLRQLKLGILEP